MRSQAHCPVLSLLPPLASSRLLHVGANRAAIRLCGSRRGDGGSSAEDWEDREAHREKNNGIPAPPPHPARIRTGKYKDGRQGAAALGVDANLRAQALRYHDPAAGPLAAAEIQRRNMWKACHASPNETYCFGF